MSWKIRSASALAVAALVSLTACGGGGTAASGSACEFGPTDDSAWSEQLEQAVSEGQVNWYHILAPTQGERVIQAFNEVCPGVKVVATATGAALLPVVEQQIQSGGEGADVFSWSDEEWFKANEESLAEFNGPFSSEFAEEAYFVPEKIVMLQQLPIGVLAWNTNEFPDGFEDFEDLEDPAVKGRLGMREDITVAYTGYLRFLEEKFGADHFEALAAQEPSFYASAYAIPNAIASGEIGVSNSGTPGAVAALKADGAPIDFSIPQESFTSPTTMGILAESKRPAAAAVFVEFLLSEEGQKAIVGNGESGSPIGVEGSADLSQSVLLESATVTPQVKAEYEEKFNRIFRGR